MNIASDAGRRGTIGQVNYGAAKAGVLGLTMCAAREWAKYKVRVNTVGFGVVETPMTEMIRSEKFADTYLAQIPVGRSRGAGLHAPVRHRFVRDRPQLRLIQKGGVDKYVRGNDGAYTLRLGSFGNPAAGRIPRNVLQFVQQLRMPICDAPARRCVSKACLCTGLP